MDEVAPDLEKNWTLRGHFLRCEMLQKIQKYTGAFPCNPRPESRITSCPRSDPMLSVLWRAVTRLPQPSHPGPVRWTSARLPPGDGTSQMRDGRSKENVLYNLYSWVMLRPHHITPQPQLQPERFAGRTPRQFGSVPWCHSPGTSTPPWPTQRTHEPHLGDPRPEHTQHLLAHVDIGQKYTSIIIQRPSLSPITRFIAEPHVSA